MTIKTSTQWQETPSFEHNIDDCWEAKLQQHIYVIGDYFCSTWIEMLSDHKSVTITSGSYAVGRYNILFTIRRVGLYLVYIDGNALWFIISTATNQIITKIWYQLNGSR